MLNLSINELVEMQNKLQNRMKDKWLPITPENGHFSLLWMYEELGEVVSILKKRGNAAVMNDEGVRAAFVEELTDALMYYIDLMTCFGISPEELSKAYVAKHEKNMQRDFVTEHEKFLNSDRESCILF